MASLWRLVEAFERAEIQFIPEIGGGVGLRLREKQGE